MTCSSWQAKNTLASPIFTSNNDNDDDNDEDNDDDNDADNDDDYYDNNNDEDNDNDDNDNDNNADMTMTTTTTQMYRLMELISNSCDFCDVHEIGRSHEKRKIYVVEVGVGVCLRGGGWCCEDTDMESRTIIRAYSDHEGAFGSSDGTMQWQLSKNPLQPCTFQQQPTQVTTVRCQKKTREKGRKGRRG